MPRPLPKIKSIQLSNFKCFHEVSVDFNKITLLTGANSSGKSSLIYGLLSALQTENFPLYYSPNGQYVKMGDFEEFCFKHKLNANVGITLKISDWVQRTVDLRSEWIGDSKNKMPELIKLDVSSEHFNINIHKNKNYTLGYEMNQDSIFEAISGKSKRSRLGNVIEKDITKMLLRRSMKQAPKSEKIDLNLAYKNYLTTKKASNLQFKSIDAIYQINSLKFLKAQSILANICGLLDSINDNLNYIDSFRVLPERTYYKEVIPDEKIGKYGENFVQQIVEWENHDSLEYHNLNEILRELGLLHEIKTRKFKGGRIELRAKTKRSRVETSLLDVGFGVSQLLPILVADLQLPKGSTLIISQPEMHLHPSVQASLANYFIAKVNDEKKNYILETHSEYLIHRLRKNIVRNVLKQDDIKTFYFENSMDGSIIHDIEFTPKGAIKNAPKGFFETYMIDVMDIAMES